MVNGNVQVFLSLLFVTHEEICLSIDAVNWEPIFPSLDEMPEGWLKPAEDGGLRPEVLRSCRFITLLFLSEVTSS